MTDLDERSPAPTSTNLLTLPTELLTEEILSQIPVSSLVSCLLTCKYLHRAIQSSIRLQYHFKLKQYAMVDNPSSSSTSYTYSSRLEMLEERERRWRELEYDWRGKVSVPKDISGYYTASAEYYLLGRDNGRTRLHANKGVYAMKMPRTKAELKDLERGRERRGREGGRWELFDEEKVIIDFTSCIDQQDLIATILAVPQGPASYTTYIHLIQHSTGHSHPLAQHPLIPLHDLLGYTIRPYVSFEIAGTHIALIITHYTLSHQAFCLYVWNWRTGKLKGKMVVPTRDVAFLREDVVLYARAGGGGVGVAEGVLQAIQIPMHDDDNAGDGNEDEDVDVGIGGGSDSGGLRVICALELPPLINGALYTSDGLRCDPAPFHNPSSSSTWSSDFTAPPLHTSTPFFPNPEETILTLFLTIASPRASDHLALITHRAALLSVIDQALRPSDPSHPSSPSDPLEPSPSDPSSPILPFPPSPSATHPDTSSPPRIAWPSWGPTNTRILRTNTFINPFLITSVGTRWVRLASGNDVGLEWDFGAVPWGGDAGGPRRRIEVFDFNRVAIRKMVNEWEAKRGSASSTSAPGASPSSSDESPSQSQSQPSESQSQSQPPSSQPTSSQDSISQPSSPSPSQPQSQSQPPPAREPIQNIPLAPAHACTPRGPTLFLTPTTFPTTASLFRNTVTTRLPFIVHTVVPRKPERARSTKAKARDGEDGSEGEGDGADDADDADEGGDGDEEGEEWRVKVSSAGARTAADVWRWGAVAMTGECLIGIMDGSDDVWSMDELDLLHFG